MEGFLRRFQSHLQNLYGGQNQGEQIQHGQGGGGGDDSPSTEDEDPSGGQEDQVMPEQDLEEVVDHSTGQGMKLRVSCRSML